MSAREVAAAAVPTVPAAAGGGTNVLRVRADQDRCCGAGLCTLNVPEVFDQREEDGVVVVLEAMPPADLAEAVREAVGLCPSGAISVVEAGGDDEDDAGS